MLLMHRDLFRLLLRFLKYEWVVDESLIRL